MSAIEQGKKEEVLESTSSAELPQVAAADAAADGDAASENETAVTAEATAKPAADDAGRTTQAADLADADDGADPVDGEQDAELEVAAAPVATDAQSLAESPPETSAPSVEGVAEASDDIAPDASVPEQVAAADTPAVESAESEVPSTTPSTSEAAPEPADPPKFRRGQVLSGIITKTSPTAVAVDLGDGDDGIVPGRELELMTRKLLESLTVGANVDVYVVNPRNHRGETVLSINHALEELDWRKAKKFAKSKEVYQALIGGYNKGGLIVRFGRLRGFVPQSQLAEERARSVQGETPEERYGPMVNQPIGVKVMEVDRGRNRLILSERAAMREVRQQRKQELIQELNVGEIRTGKVVSLENFGAFVDIGGAEGLVHLSELAWGHVTHPRQVVNIGDEVEVEVISVNPDARRIGLSRRRVLGDPWDEIATSLRRGQLVRGRVTKLTKFGAFARLIDHDAVEGLIHISELSSDRVSHPREIVNRGEELVLRIVKIDIKERRLGLSLKSVNSTEYLDLDWEMAIQESANLTSEPAAPNSEVEAETQADE